jgi:hypothetical protein
MCVCVRARLAQEAHSHTPPSILARCGSASPLVSSLHGMRRFCFCLAAKCVCQRRCGVTHLLNSRNFLYTPAWLPSFASERSHMHVHTVWIYVRKGVRMRASNSPRDAPLPRLSIWCCLSQTRYHLTNSRAVTTPLLSTSISTKQASRASWVASPLPRNFCRNGSCFPRSGWQRVYSLLVRRVWV